MNEFLSGSSLAAVGLALASAVSWGAGDFSGGLATRRAGVFSVIVLMHAAGLVMLLTVALLWGEPLPSSADLFWGIAAGLVGAVGLASLYQALAVGRMGIAAPLIAVQATVLPVLAGILFEGLPGPVQMIGFALALVSVWLVSNPGSIQGRPTGLRYILLSGIALGGFAILMDRISPEAVFWPLVGARFASTLFMWAVAQVSRQPWKPPAPVIPLIVLGGLLDLGGNVFFLLAIQAGRLDVAVVLSGLYPAFTVLLARLVLKEPITRPHALGILAVALAIPLIAA